MSVSTTSHITRKGQLTIDHNEVKLQPTKSVVIETAGVLTSGTVLRSAEQLREAGEESIAQESLTRAKG